MPFVSQSLRLLFAVAAFTASLSAAEPRLVSVVPVVGSTGGLNGANFKTGLQLQNPSDAPANGVLIFRALGRITPPDGGDPQMAWELAPRQTKSYEDVVAEMGQSGLGSLDVMVENGAAPNVIARAFDDGGANGTKGVTVAALSPDDAIGPGQTAALLAPIDPIRARLNLGVRTLSEGAIVRISLHEADGTTRLTLPVRTYAADYFVQQPAAAFLELPASLSVGANESIAITVLEGSAFFYATQTDNKTNDPSIQIAENRNQVPTSAGITAAAKKDTAVTIRFSADDPDNENLLFTLATAPGHGTLGAITRIDGHTIEVVYTPAAGFTGADGLSFVVDDENGGSTMAVATIAVGGNDSTPTAVDAAVTVQEDRTITITLRGIDPDGDTLAFAIAAGVDDGTLGPIVITGPDTATVTYRPRTNFDGSDSFTFSVSDGEGSDTGTVTINITSVPDAPNAANDAFNLLEDGVLNVAALGVLTNDRDPENQALNAQLVATTSNGTLVLNADGSFSYTPNANFFGSDSFTYRANDGSLSSSVATVTITVTGVNDAPSFTASANATSNEDAGAQVVTSFLTAITAGPNEAAQTVTINITGNDNPTLFASGPSIAANGTLTYTAAANANGTANITVTLSDNGGTANGGVNTSGAQNFTIIVTAIDDVPVAVNDAATVGEDDPATAVDVLFNDTDIDGGPMSIASVTQPLNVSVVITGGGTGLTYQPNADFCGQNTFTYTLNGGSVGTVTMTVTCVDDLPTAVDDATSVNEDAPATAIAVLANDSDVDAGPISIGSVTQPGNGTVVITGGDSGLTYQPNANFCGALEVFTYTLNGGSIGTVSVTVNCVDDPPVANEDMVNFTEDDPATAINVLANDSDGGDGGPMSIASVMQGGDGEVLITGGGTGLTYEPDSNFCGSDWFTYTLNGGSTATVVVMLSCVDDDPVAVNDTVTINEDAGATFVSVLASDPDGGANSISGVTQGTNGAVVIINPGVTYAPNSNFCGTDTFTYTLSPGGSTATVTMIVNCINDAPVANPDNYSVARGGSLLVPAAGVLTNDTDVEGATLNSYVVATTTHGSLALNADGSFQYIHDGSAFLTDSFTYQATEGPLNAQIVTVTITITQSNLPPEAMSDSYNVVSGGTLTTTAANGVLQNDTDPEGAPMTAVLVGNVSNGTLTLNADGSFEYVNDGAPVQSDSFSYQANDGQANSGTVTVIINLTVSNSAPVAVNDTYNVAKGGTLNVSDPGIIGNDTDGDGDSLTATIVNNAQNGVVTLNADGSFTYEHDDSATTTDTFTYTVSDGQATSNVATVTITIHAVNTPPVAVADGPFVTNEDVVFNNAAPGVLDNDTDVDGDSLTAIIVTQPANGTVVLNSDGSFVYNPAPDFSGADSFTYKANDGLADSNTVTVSFTVNNANDAPVVQAGNSVAYTENGAAVTLEPLFVVTDVDSPMMQSAQVLVSGNFVSGDVLACPGCGGLISANYNAGVLTLSGTDTLANYQAALQTVTFSSTSDDPTTAPRGIDWYVNDGGATNIDNLANDTTVNVTVVNDAPTFTTAGNQTVDEDTGPHSVPNFATGSTIEGGQTLSYVIDSVSNPSFFSVAPAIAADGTLSYTLSANAFGTATIDLHAHDSGGTANGGVDDSASQSFDIIIGPVNDAPTFTKGVDQTANEDTGLHTVPNWIVASSAGPTNENTQIVSYVIDTVSDGTLFSVAPAVANDGTLTYTLAANASGVATVTLHAQDDGGVLNGGVDASATQSFTISVTDINDAPSFTKGADPYLVNEDSGATSVIWATGISAGPADEAGQNVNFVIELNTNPSLFSAQPAIAPDGTLTFTPVADAFGSTVLMIHLHDDGGTAGGGVEDSPSVQFVIELNPVNDPPSFTPGTDLTVPEDAGNVIAPNWASARSAGPPNETGQVLSFQATVTGTTGTLTFQTAPAVNATSGTFTFRADANTCGTATVDVTLTDDAGTPGVPGDDLSSPIHTVTLTVQCVNDAPSFTKGADQTLNEDAPAQTINPWATAISPGPGETDALTFNVSNDNNALFTAGGQPAVTATGVLTYTPAPNANGTTLVTVTLTDDGGTPGVPGDDITTGPQTFNITINAVNDAPAFTIAGNPPFIILGAGAQSVPTFAAGVTDGDPELTQVLTFNFTQTANSGSLTLSAGPSIDPATGNLTYTPNAGTLGTLTFSVTLSDNGSNIAPNVNVSGAQSFTIVVEKAPEVTTTVPVNGAPGVSPLTNITVNFDQPVSVTLVPATFRINCNAGPDLAFAYVGGTTNVTTVTLDPTATLPAGNCVVTVVANEVHDTDTYDPPDGLAADYVFSFVTNTPPTAVDDNTTALGHVTLTVADAQGVLGNDTDPDAGADLDVQNFGTPMATAQGGTITFTQNGGYTYNSQVLDQNLTDTVTYTVTDQFGSTDTGQLTINLGPRFIYVDDNHPTVTPDGRDIHPWKTMQQAQANSAANDTILVMTGTYTDHIVLQAGQSLIGQGIAANHVVAHNAVNFTVLTAGAAPTISRAAAGDTITLSVNNTIRGVTIGATSGKGIVGNNFTSVTINDNVIVSTNGNAALHLDTGSVTATFNSVSATAGANNGLIFNALTGTMNINGGNISNTAGATLNLTGGSLAGTIASNFSTTGSSLINIASRTANALTLSGALSGSGTIAASGNAAGTTLTFSGTQTLNTGGNVGVNLAANPGTISFIGGALQITTTSGAGFIASGATGNVNVTSVNNTITTGTGIPFQMTGGVDIGGSGMTFRSISANGAASGIVLADTGASSFNLNGPGPAGSGGTLQSIVGSAVSLTNTNNVHLHFLTINGAATGINGSNFGALTLRELAVTAVSGLVLNTGTVNNFFGSNAFTSLNTSGGVNGVALTSVGGTFNIATGSLIGSSGATFLVNGGSGSVTYGGSITQNNAARAVDVQNRNGALAFGGAINAGTSSSGIFLNNNSGGTIAFGGALTLNTATNPAFTFTNGGATGAAVTVTSGTLNIDTTSGAGINAASTTVGSGSLTISGANNSVLATTGRAINIDGVTATVTLRDVSVTGGGTTTGVFLNNTGGSGSFTVTGAASTAGTGGTIANIGGADAGSITAVPTQGTGMYIGNATNVSLSNMIFGAIAGTMNNFAIRGDNVNNFTLKDSEFLGTFGTNFGFDEATIRFGSQNVTTGLRGTALFQGNVIGGGIEDNLAVYVYGANTLNITIQDSADDQAVFPNNNAVSGNDGFFLESGGTSNVTVNVLGVAFNGARGDLLQLLTKDSSTQTSLIQGNQFHNAHSNIISGGGGIAITGGGTAINVDYHVDDNTFKGMRASAIFSSFGGAPVTNPNGTPSSGGTISALVTDNIMGTPGNATYDTSQANRGSMEGMFFFGGIDAKQLGSSGDINYALRIEGNTIRDVNGIAGILLRSNQQDSGGQARLEATIHNNTMAEMGPNVAGGIYMQPGGASLDFDKGTMGANISNNNIDFTIGGASANGDAVAFDQAGIPASFYMPGYTSATSSVASVLATFLKTTKSNVFTNAQASGGGGVLSNTGAVANANFVLTVPVP